MKLDVLRKAILYECSKILVPNKNSSEQPSRPTTVHEVTSFYTQLRDHFNISVDISSVMTDESGYDEETNKLEEMKEWLNDNEILFCSYQRTSFYFCNNEDAAAFRLKWL